MGHYRIRSIASGWRHSRTACALNLTLGRESNPSQPWVIQTLAIRTESHLCELMQGARELSELSWYCLTSLWFNSDRSGLELTH